MKILNQQDFYEKLEIKPMDLQELGDVSAIQGTLVHLLSEYDKKHIDAEEFIDRLTKRLKAELENSEEPIRLKGDIPFFKREGHTAAYMETTYKYKGQKYQIVYSNTHTSDIIDNTWRSIILINDSNNDLGDPSMRMAIDKNGQLKKLEEFSYVTEMDPEETCKYLIKQWVYLQSL